MAHAPPFTDHVNSDFSQLVVVDRSKATFVSSPAGGVERIKLDRKGGEIARATTLVRFAPGSRFDEHVHYGGEEFLVLEGRFCDEAAAYPTGTYVRNPVGSRHAPWSDTGCLLFVKLLQMSLLETEQTLVDTRAFAPGDLYRDETETVAIRRLGPGETRLPTGQDEEIFLLDGLLKVAGRNLPRHSWLRMPRAMALPLESDTGIVYWSKCKPFPS